MANNAIHNPHGKPVAELPVIYGFNNGGNTSNWMGCLIAEDGTPLGTHVCSSESFMLDDLGILEGTGHWRHEEFKKHYPDGYVMEFVSLEDVETHVKLNKAFEAHKLTNPGAESATETATAPDPVLNVDSAILFELLTSQFFGGPKYFSDEMSEETRDVYREHARGWLRERGITK